MLQLRLIYTPSITNYKQTTSVDLYSLFNVRYTSVSNICNTCQTSVSQTKQKKSLFRHTFTLSRELSNIYMGLKIVLK